MGSVPVFQNPYGLNGNSPSQIDKVVGTAYEVVRQVAEALEYIKHVSAHLESIYRVEISIEGLDEIAANMDELEILISNIDAILAYGINRTIVSDQAPLPPLMNGQFWWNSLTGNLYTWYVDANSSQFVQINTVLAPVPGEIITPQKYGAVGDGIHNDGPAIVAALAASKHIRLPPGDYLINGTVLQPQSGTLIEGPGRLVKSVYSGTGTDPFFLISGKDNITIDGVGGRYPVGSTQFVYTVNSSRIKVTRCKLGTAVEWWKSGVFIFFGRLSTECEASFNIMYGGLAGVATGGDPMFGSGSTGGPAGTEDGTVDGVDILYNAIHAPATEAIDINWDTHNFRIIGNHGKRIGQRGDAINECIDIGGGTDAVTDHRCRDGEVAFNVFELADTRANAAGQQNPSGGIHIKQFSSGIIAHHNHITSIGQPGTNGITFSNAIDCMAHDNVLDWFQYGTYYVTANTRAHSRNNKLLNITVTGITSYIGGAYTDCMTNGNEILGLNATGHGMELATFNGGDVSNTWVRGGFNAASRTGIYLRADCSNIKAHNVRIENCQSGMTVLAPHTEIVGGISRNNTLNGLDLQAADIRVANYRCQDNATTGYQVAVSVACTRLFINGLVIDDSRGTPLARGISFTAADNCYINGIHVPRFLVTAVGNLHLLTNSTVIGMGSLQAQATTLITDAVTAAPGVQILTIDTEAAAATDNCATITYSGKAGDIMRVRAANSARDVVMKDGTGNLRLNSDFTLNNVEDSILLQWSGTTWDELARSDNGA